MHYELIVGLGEVLWDMLPQGRQLGGAPANFAYHVSQLGYQGIIVSAVGNDALGNDIVKELDSHGIASRISIVDAPTGVVNVSVDDKGIPSYEIVENVAWDNIPYSEDLQYLASQAVAVCFGSLAQREVVSRDTIMQFIESLPPTCLKVFDINLRQRYYTREIIEWSLEHCDVLKLNDDELAIIKEMLEATTLSDDSFVAKLKQLYDLKIVIFTCGEKGSSVYYDDEVNFELTPQVEVVDTVGAGDSFTAAFVATLLQGKSVVEAHRQAVATSATTCTHKGAI
ncbi:MAG: carbohydrate kinase [Muribaculaceae bacterium]|nr:carbohydrate kinase [Muribaculaceae bacterium]